MGRTARERLAKLLDDAQASGAFSAQILAPADALQVEVDGVGAVHPPVRAPLAKKLIAAARPAMFGRGEQTLTDTTVRDTWEITSDLVTLSGPAWETTLGAVLDDVRDELGLPPTTKLRAELHAMLVYGKGQFFLPHQDSEKADAMVGTLVVSLPSAHTGGELVVEHGGRSVTYRVLREKLSFVAFYADCRHEVKPVRSGYRVTLTFNLLAGSEADAQGAGPVADLAHCLTGHFTTPADIAARARLRGVCHHPERGPGALPVRIRGLHGQLRQHAGPVVSPGRGRGVAAGPGVRCAGRSRVAVGAVGTARSHRGRRPGRGTCWRGVARAVLEKDRIAGRTAGTALYVAAGLGAAETAAMLLEPFRMETVAPEHAGGLAAAAGQYGEEWTRGVIAGWFGPGHYREPDRYEWVERLPGLCAALRAAGGPEVARLLAAGAWGWMGDQLRLWTTTARAEIRQPRLEMLSSPLVRLLEAADHALRDEIVAALGGYGDNVLGCLMPALRSAAALPADARRAAGLDVVARDCGQRLGAITVRPLRGEDDWSIEWTGCGCDLCDTLGAFLGSRSQRIFEWPLATGGRRHVHTQIDSAALPVRHQTRRQGRPYMLVLTKTDELFTREKDARHNAVTDLAWLTSAWGDGPPGTL